MHNRTIPIVVGALSIALSPLVAAADYTIVKSAMLEAIDAPGGTANGTLTGPIADKFATTTGSSAPIKVAVTTLKSFQREGCKRLNVRLSQDNVPTKEGRLTTFGIDYGINLCRDGTPPTEGIDSESVGKAMINVEAASIAAGRRNPRVP